MASGKEVYRLTKNVGKLTDGQVSVDDYDGETITITIQPNAGLYKGGRFTFWIQIPDNYPDTENPAVWCNSNIYHPNIDTTESHCDIHSTNVCLNLLEYGTWDNAFGLEGIVIGLLFLMHNPNFEDPLSPFFDSSDPSDYDDLVKKFMSGEEVEGIKYESELVVSDTTTEVVNTSDDTGEEMKGGTLCNENDLKNELSGDCSIFENEGGTGMIDDVDQINDYDEDPVGELSDVRLIYIDGEIMLLNEQSYVISDELEKIANDNLDTAKEDEVQADVEENVDITVSEETDKDTDMPEKNKYQTELPELPLIVVDDIDDGIALKTVPEITDIALETTHVKKSEEQRTATETAEHHTNIEKGLLLMTSKCDYSETSKLQCYVTESTEPLTSVTEPKDLLSNISEKTELQSKCIDTTEYNASTKSTSASLIICRGQMCVREKVIKKVLDNISYIGRKLFQYLKQNN